MYIELICLCNRHKNNIEGVYIRIHVWDTREFDHLSDCKNKYEDWIDVNIDEATCIADFTDIHNKIS